MFSKALLLVGFVASLVSAVPTRRAAPTVKLDTATVTGSADGATSKFFGIPFAQPPTGNNRFNLPQPLPAYNGTITATSMGPSCPQQPVQLPIVSGLTQQAIDFLVNSIYGVIFPDDEDCLTINVIKPSTATPTSKLPVAVWIFGGGFELGGPSMYDGTSIVESSIDKDQPVIYVSFNYRVSAWGFLPGKEVKAAGVGNLGLWDQRAALKWVNKYISAFGGDPTKVTIWGESAGAISVALQMLYKGGDTEGLFRAGFMESGSPIPVGDITNGQVYYDEIVANTGCSGASDTLACLRTVPFANLKTAVSKTPGIFAYQSLALAYLPRTDGVFLTEDPQTAVVNGNFANIPIVNGDCDDEGTLFTLSTLNITNDDELKEYVKTYWLPKAADSAINQLATLYPADITQGSPYDTGILNAITPDNKRIASFIGDAVFQGPRRLFLRAAAAKGNKVWSYSNKRLKALPVLGAAHGTDILNVYGGGDMADYLIQFVNTLNPNGVHINWPQYSQSSPSLLTFQDGLFPLTITQDTYRLQAMDFLINTTLANPI